MKIYQLDAFTDTAFTGNPAAVVPNADGLTKEQMLKISKEMNLSETAFVFKGGDKYDFEVKFFTPTEEVDLCGHASIATFSLLKHLNRLPQKDPIIQKTKAGLLEIQVDDQQIIMRQAQPTQIVKSFSYEKLCHVLQISPSTLTYKNYVPEIWSTGLKDLLVPIQSVQELKNMTPDMNKLAAFSHELDIIGIHAFTFDENGQIYARNFAPACGINEEAATGTSNGALGAYLAHHKKEKNLSFTVQQGQWMGSPSQIFVEVKNENEIWVGGQAVIVLEGRIAI